MNILSLKFFQITATNIGISILIPMPLYAQTRLTADEILDRIDRNMVSTTVIKTSKMVIHQKDRVDTKKMKVWGRGKNSAFVEFTKPTRDKGTKYLRLEKNLWMYLPNIEKVIKISGHLLRQSMMVKI